MQNAGLAIIIIASSFPAEIADEVIGVPIVYQILNTLMSISFLSVLLKLKWVGKKGDGGGSPTCCSTFRRMPCYSGGEEEEGGEGGEENMVADGSSIDTPNTSKPSSTAVLMKGDLPSSDRQPGDSGRSVSEVEFSSTPATSAGALDGSQSQKADR